MVENKSNVTPLVSIIMPAYNSEKYIRESIESVLHQTLTNWELLILDDGSTDQTCEIIKSYTQKDKRIRLIQNKCNLGVSKTRNKGFDLSYGEYIALLDSDDLWNPNKLEIQIQTMKQTNTDFSYTSYSMINEEGQKTYQDYIVPSSITLESMLKCNVIGCSTVMIKKQIIETKRFNPNYYHEDYVLWLELLQNNYKAIGIQEVLVQYRVFENSRSGNKKNSAKYRFDIYRNYLHLSFFKSCYYFMIYAFNGLKKYQKL